MKSCFMFMLVGTLFLPLSAFTWNKKPAAVVEGVLGENVILKWKFSLVSANETFDYFLLLQNGYDMLKYSHDVGVVTYSAFTGRVGLASNGTPAFILTNLQRSNDKAKFCCKVGIKRTDGTGDVHRDCVVFKLLVRPSIVEISRNQTLNESNDVTLSCNATGTPPPNVTWTKAGNQDKQFKPGPFLPLRNISRGQDGSYWCTAENGAGKSTASVRVIVQFPPSIEYISHDTTATEGDYVKLFCNSTGNPRPNITWTYLNGSGARIITRRETLTLSNVTRNQAGKYQCTATNDIMTPNTANVHVTINYPPEIKRGPVSQTVNDSGELELFCNATGNPPPNITWSKVEDPAVQLPSDKLLKLKNVSKTDSGVYHCRASNGIGSDAISSANVTVNYKPTATRLTSNVTGNAVILNLSVTFHCSVDSVPPPVLELRFKNSSLGYFTDGRFTIERVRTSDEGKYECVPSNIYGAGRIATLHLAVVVPPSIEYISSNTTANETDDVKLFCNSTGSPHPNITWTLLKGPHAKVLGTEEALILSDVGKSQAGAYRCVAANGVTTPKTAYVHVTINYKPEIKDSVRMEINSWLNHETNVTCKAEGVPIPDITWTRNGIAVFSVQSEPGVKELRFTPEDANDFGDYVCTAKNFLGSTKKIVTINELVAPEAPKILRIDPGVDNMEIYWHEAISNPDSPVLDYLVMVKEKDEPDRWRNCTRVQTSDNSLMCVVNDLRSGTVYIVQLAARNVVGYSTFTETEAETAKPAVPGTADAQKQQQLSRVTIDGIIAGVICFCSLVVVIVAIVTQRRPCDIGCKKYKMNKSPEECIDGHENTAMEENPESIQLEERA